MTTDQIQDARIDGAVKTLTAQVQPWAHEMLGLDMADTRYVIEETLCQLQQVLVEHGKCELPYLGRIERTYGDSGPGWRFTPDQYALGLLPPSSAAAQLMG
jgi:hypothetical protein